jgi:[acyl-carrier-protein] S-malonyltransferase
MAAEVPQGSLLRPGHSVGDVTNLRGSTPVLAPHGGTIVEWIVEDGDLVSPGQPLVRLHPESE